MTKPCVIKIGGHQIGDYDFLDELPEVVRMMNAPAVIVHGGGVEISDLQRKLGITPRYVDGVRITDIASLQVVEMVLRGAVNARLVAKLIAGGLDAQGLSGVDRGLMRAQKMPNEKADMEFTGEVTHVRGDVLQSMLDSGITPVVAPVCLGESGERFNVNADHVAGAIATAIDASRIVFITNVEGVLEEGTLRQTIYPDEAKRMIEDEIIFGGMIPKVKTALHALEQGAKRVVITNLEGLRTHGGTVFSQEQIAANTQED